jgi:hypothetical protein
VAHPPAVTPGVLCVARGTVSRMRNTGRPPCGRELDTGTCAELQGHKSMCRTSAEADRYAKQMAALDPRAARWDREHPGEPYPW